MLGCERETNDAEIGTAGDEDDPGGGLGEDRDVMGEDNGGDAAGTVRVNFDRSEG